MGHAPHQNPADVKPHDPEHDIDAKTTTIWVVGWAFAFLFGMYVLLVVFDEINMRERQRKIDTLPATELEEQRAKERQFLNGEIEEGLQGKSIDQVIKEMARK